MLSLLLIWQLLASVLAHPLHGIPADVPGSSIHSDRHAAGHGSVTAPKMSSGMSHHESNLMHMSDMMPCHEMQADQVSDSDAGSGLGHHAGMTECKCPCTGTPALMPQSPTLSMSFTPALTPVMKAIPLLASIPGKLLRPPIH